jgi:CRISPR system Cascade subunit CasB
VASEKYEQFVQYVLTGVGNAANKGFGARLRKADNETTAYQSWDILSRWVDLQNEGDRRSYALIAASLARTRRAENGTLGLGRALLTAYGAETRRDETEQERSPAHTRLRRLLACADRAELLGVLRPMLRLLESKEARLDYARLLSEVLWFDKEDSRARCRARWAQEFYRREPEE